MNAQGQIDTSNAKTGVNIFPGEYLSITGFCLSPESVRFKGVEYSHICSLTISKSVDLEKKIHLDGYDIKRWSLASLAITKYGLPVPSAEDCNYVVLEISALSAKLIPSEYQERLLWKFALINGLASMVYMIAWNNSFLGGHGENYVRGFILMSFTPLVLSPLCFGISKLSHVFFQLPIRFAPLYYLTRSSSRQHGGLSDVMSSFVFCCMCHRKVSS
jgi:hypothetical protein